MRKIGYHIANALVGGTYKIIVKKKRNLITFNKSLGIAQGAHRRGRKGKRKTAQR